jgi:peptidyl-prolyl cis-trans isomerase D
MMRFFVYNFQRRKVMLDKMREGSQGVAAKVILSVIILSFALAGISSYLVGGNAAVAVLVNDEEISRESVEQAYQNERASLQQQYGEQFDILAANPNFAQQVRAQATQKLISETLIDQAIAEMGLRVGDEQVKAEIRKMTEFEVDGKFSNERYLSLLRRASYTPAQFSFVLKKDLARRQLLQTLVGSEFVLPKEVSQVNQLQSQQRIAKVLTVAAADFRATEKISEADINAYYEENKQLFQEPEQVSVDYVLLDGRSLTDRITLTPAEIETYYDQHLSDYQRAERRKVAHILVQGDTEEAQQKAAAILAELKAGADFGQLAAKKSDDTFSAKNEGELDWFERGVNDPAFDDAAFLLTNEAPLSELVKSKFGYHIIKLIAVEEGETLPLVKVESQVTAALQKEKIVELYDDFKQQLGEVAFESPDSLDEAAGVINGKILHTGLFSAQQAPEPLTNKTVLNILFDADFRDEGVNSEVIELSENKSIVVRVNEYKAPAIQALAEVSDSIAEQLQTERARAKAQEFVESLMAKLNAAEPVASLLSEKKLKFSEQLTFSRYNRSYDYQVVDKVFKLAKPAADQVTRGWVTTTTGDFAIVELSKVVDAQPVDTETAMQLTTVLERTTSDATYQAFIAQLMENADIKYVKAD